MVTMNSDKSAARRRPEPNSGSCTGTTTNDEAAIVSCQPPSTSEVAPNHLLYRKVWKSCFSISNTHFLFVDGKNHRKNAR